MKNPTWTWIIIGLALVGGYFAITSSQDQQPKG